MAKKRAESKPETRTADDGGVRVPILLIRGTPEYRDYVKTISKQTLIPATAIFRDALALWAERRGLPAPPQR